MVFWLARHGQTEWNKQGRWQGHTDVELAEEGRLQALALQAFLQSVNPVHVISSDLKRAHETAQIARPQALVKLDPRLREVHLGLGEGKTRSEIESILGPPLNTQTFNFHKQNLDFRYPGGESRREALVRFKSGLLDHLNQNPGQPTLFLTHGLIIRIFCHDVTGLDDERFRARNCSVFEFEKTNDQIRFRQIFSVVEDEEF